MPPSASGPAFPDGDETLLEHFDRLAGLDDPAREEELDRIAGERPALAGRLRALLAADEGSGFLDTSDPHTLVFGFDSDQIGQVLPGDRLGEFEILDAIGQGGMGAVFRARQDSTGREVALKVLRDGFAREETVRRFELEARILGTLDHPNLARVVAAGAHATATGRVPWIAMELVRGRPLLEWMRETRPNTRTRLEVAAAIADGVQHAHGKGIVHRDLKPANVLVDAEGEARVLDFGVARAIDPDLRTSSLMTDAGRLVGTIAWMSPEQTQGASDLIDVRSDVYALGLLTHALLVGDMPYELPDSDIHRAIEIIRDQEPLPLGRRDQNLRGDVETIVLRALAKEPERRYPTAAAFAADIRRHLDHQPIEARPSSAFYRLGKLARRHRVAFGLSAATVLALVVGLVGTSTGWSRALDEGERRAEMARVAQREATEAQTARREAQRAQGEEAAARKKEAAARAEADRAREAAEERAEELAREEARLRRTNELMRLVLTPGNVNENTELNRAARLLLERAERDVSLLGNQDTAVRGSFDAILGQAYNSLGEAESAREHLERAREALVASYGEASVPVAEVDVTLGVMESYRGAAAAIETYFDPAFRVLEKELPPLDPRLLHARLEYCRALSLGRRPKEADDVAAEALEELGESMTPAQAPDALGLMNIRLVNALRRGRGEEALGFLEKMKSSAEEHGLPEDHPFIIIAHSQVVGTLDRALGRPDEALAMIKEAIRLSSSRFGPEAATTLNHRDTHADFLCSKRRFDEARVIANEIRAIDERHRDRPPRGPRIHIVLARLAAQEGDIETAFDSYGRAAEAARLRPERYIALELEALSQQGRIRLAQKRLKEGREILERTFATRLAAVGEGIAMRGSPRELAYLSRALPVGKERVDIEARALAYCREHLPPGDRETMMTGMNLAYAASRSGDWKRAAAAYEFLPAFIEGGFLKGRNTRILDECTYAGCACLRSDRTADAIPHLERGYEHAQRTGLSRDQTFVRLIGFLDEAYRKTGRAADGERLKKKHAELLRSAAEAKPKKPASK